MNATPADSIPAYVASCRGTCEKEAIASSEKRSILRSVYFVSPAWRASRWYETAVCVKPTHTVMPRRKRERSVIASSAFSARRSSRRKSPELGSRSTCASLSKSL